MMDTFPTIGLQTRFVLRESAKSLTGLDDSHRALEPAPGAKTAGWLVGHLAVTGDFARRLAGRKPALCPVEWRSKFSPGTFPSANAADYPPMAELREMFTKVYSDLAEHVGKVDPATLTAPNPYEPARADFPTTGEFLTYLASGHISYHLGQLVAWRAAAGLGRI